MCKYEIGMNMALKDMIPVEVILSILGLIHDTRTTFG